MSHYANPENSSAIKLVQRTLIKSNIFLLDLQFSFQSQVMAITVEKSMQYNWITFVAKLLQVI